MTASDLTKVVWLDDGMTFEGYIAAVDGIHGSLAFVYRPMFVLAHGGAKDDVNSAPNEQASTTRAAQHASRQLLSWSSDGVEAPPISPETCLKLHNVMFFKLWEILCMRRSSDARPDGRLLEDQSLQAEAQDANLSPEELIAKNLGQASPSPG